MQSCSGYYIYGAKLPWSSRSASNNAVDIIFMVQNYHRALGVPCNNAMLIIFMVPYYHGALGVLCNNGVDIMFIVPNYHGAPGVPCNHAVDIIFMVYLWRHITIELQECHEIMQWI